MNAATPPFQQLLGQTEKTLNAILNRLLAGAVSEPQWVALALIAGSGGSAGRDEFTGQVANALKTDPETAEAHMRQLAAKGLVVTAPEAGSTVTLTEDGQRFVRRVQQQADDVTQRLWGDLPAADLDVARSVLSTVLERAQSEFASLS